MIIEYRMNTYRAKLQYSRVLRTYKGVTNVQQNGNTTYLTGTIPAVVDTRAPTLSYIRYAQTFLIAAIHLAPGEYLEVVDVPRD